MYQHKIYHYAPGCALLLYKPSLSEKIFDFLNRELKRVEFYTTCCHHEPNPSIRSINDEIEHIIINTCAGCDRRFRTLYQGIKTISLWEIIANSNNFQFPDYGSESITLHDACPVRDNNAVHDAVRILLDKMNFTVIEPAHSRGNSMCCGDSLWGKYAEEYIHSKMRAKADEMPCENVCVYCVSCVKAMKIGGKTPRYLPDLLFGETTSAGDLSLANWHGELNKFIAEHR